MGLETTLTLATVHEGIKLVVAVESKTLHPNLSYVYDVSGLIDLLPDNIRGKISAIVSDNSAVKEIEDFLNITASSSPKSVIAAASKIDNAVRNQGNPVIPGGGTFDMKDPVFGKADDLLIGLSFAQHWKRYIFTWYLQKPRSLLAVIASPPSLSFHSEAMTK